MSFNHLLPVCIVFCFALTFSGCNSSSGPIDLVAEFQPTLFADRQLFFEDLHPAGTATDLKLHSVDFVSTEIGPAAAFVFTLYWEGPINKDGFTKCCWYYDLESERTQDLVVINTNGITNQQVGTWLKQGGGVAASALAKQLMAN